eukprot:Opistho-2@12196
MADDKSGGATRVLNFNLGVLGHIDSGKTSLAKALSTVASTAAFDKNPQSQERGITLDLGFSSFEVGLPDHLKDLPYDRLQFTLVDCPGHASLIRTIIGGAQIIDLMMLVVDATKGIQTQTAECLVIGEITCDRMIIALNKIDLIPEAERAAQIEKVSTRLRKTLAATKFASALIVPVSAAPGAAEGSQNSGQAVPPMGIADLMETLKKGMPRPTRNSDGPFSLAVDHCFGIKGQGTVMTGTVISGSISVNDNVEIPSLKVVKKIKSMQMFHKPINTISQGDRAGICVTQFDPKLLERGFVCTPDTIPAIHAVVAAVSRIRYFKGKVLSKGKFHVSVGHETVMARTTFFGTTLSPDEKKTDEATALNLTREYEYFDELTGDSNRVEFVLLEFEHPILCPPKSLLIGSKLDTDIHSHTCRLAFYGRSVVDLPDKKYRETYLPSLKVFKTKAREGTVERIADDYTVIGKALFKKETNIETFAGMKVRLSTGDVGAIEGSFGQSGKYKVRIPSGVSAEAKDIVNGKKGAAGGGKKQASGTGMTAAPSGPASAPSNSGEKESVTSSSGPVRVILEFKRYVFDPLKKMRQ